MVDVEGPSEWAGDSGYFAVFYLDDTELGRVGFDDLIDDDPLNPFYDDTIVFGNRSANRVSPLLASDFNIEMFDEVHIGLGGSAGVDNIVFTPVPEPASLVIMSLGLVGLAWRRRTQR